jgi:NADH-quinone oxidoreductase subunit J
MTASFLILATLTIAGMAAAMGLRNLVHCVLALTLGFAGLAALYLQLGAQFVGFTQILVYVGAVAILAVFAIMMTQSAGLLAQPALSSSWVTGSIVAGAVFAVLAWAICSGAASPQMLPSQPEVSVNQIGDALMHRFVLPLEIIGLLLTAALIGAVVLAMREKREKP